MSPLEALILSEPGMARRLLDVHANDGTGHCLVCSDGGQTARHLWPCTIHDHATRASRQQNRMVR